MNILISNVDKLPIYEQIYVQIKNAIIAGELAEGMRCLPYGSWQRTCVSASLQRSVPMRNWSGTVLLIPLRRRGALLRRKIWNSFAKKS